MATVAAKQKRIEDIVPLLESGTETSDILRIITEGYGVSISSVEKDIKEAKLIVYERNKHKEQVRLEQTTESIKEAVKEAIISDSELEAILCTIATANMQVEEIIKGEAVIRNVTPAEQIAAIDKIYKKRGSNAPSKVAQTTKDGEDVPQQKADLSNLPIEVLQALKDAQNKPS